LVDFKLEQSQSMTILQTDEEVEAILRPLEIKFVERIVEGQLRFYRIGNRNLEKSSFFTLLKVSLGVQLSEN